MMMQRLSDERGVAAITILMVTVVLALAGSVVAFTATAELEIGGRERRAEEAFVGAEAGLDVASSYFDSVDATIEELGSEPAFCLNNPVVDDAVEYRHPDPAMANAICGIEITSPPPSNGTWYTPATGPPFIDYKVLSRAQEGRTVTRVLSSTYRVVARDVPFGMFINGPVDLNGTPALMRESLLVNGVVTSREKLDMDWDEDNQFDDPDLGWVFHKDRITSDPDPAVDCLNDTINPPQNVGCAAVFSNVSIYEKNQENLSDEIHSTSPSPYPHDRDYAHQGKIVNNEKQLVVDLPTSDVLEAMPYLKQVAQAQGNYFNIKDGKGGTTPYQPGGVGAPAKEFAENVVVYIDADEADTIKWKVDLIPGSASSDMLHTYPDGQRLGPASGIIVVRGGDLQFESGMYWSGAVFVPENEFRILGGVTCICTIYAEGFSAQGGNSNIELTPEWFQNLPPALVNVTRRSFSECEPFQASQLC